MIMLWFKHGFEAIANENEVYELQGEIKEHYKNFTAQYGKFYQEQEEYDLRE